MNRIPIIGFLALALVLTSANLAPAASLGTVAHVRLVPGIAVEAAPDADATMDWRLEGAPGTQVQLRLETRDATGESLATLGATDVVLDGAGWATASLPIPTSSPMPRPLVKLVIIHE